MILPVAQLDWKAPELRASLEPLLPGLTVEVASQIESTNSLLVDRARAAVGRTQGRRSADGEASLLVAENQSRGRGRLGRAWLSSPGASLTFSLALPLAPVDWSGLSLAVGVGLAQALDPANGTLPPQLRLKWPNDLWLADPLAPAGGRKLGGILIETVPSQGKRMCVVGVGINILHQVLGDLSSGYASLAELEPGITAPQALHRLAVPLVRTLQTFEASGFSAFVEQFEARDMLAGRRVTTSSADCPEGQAEGVDERGALRLITADGRRLAINSGEVSIKPRPVPDFRP